MHSAAVVHLARVDKLLAAADGDLLRVKLVRQGLVRRLDRVQGALGTGHLGGQVVDARGTAHLEDTVGAAETEACGLRSMTVPVRLQRKSRIKIDGLEKPRNRTLSVILFPSISVVTSLFCLSRPYSKPSNAALNGSTGIL